MSVAAYLATIVLCVVAVFVGPAFGLTQLELIGIAVAAFAAAHILR